MDKLKQSKEQALRSRIADEMADSIDEAGCKRNRKWL
jgi:hypothetical protein